VFIDPAATHGDSPDADLKDFEIRASTDGQHFSTVFSGTTHQEDKLQQFHFPQPVEATELQLVALNNYGSPTHIAVAEFEAYAAATPPSAHRLVRLLRVTAKKTVNFAQVWYIRRGLTVLPPHKHRQKGKTKMPLFPAYEMNTAAGEKASIKFAEGTVLQMNQLTDVVLTSPHLTTVQNGEVQEVVKPGSNHQIKTSIAVASAIGTIYDVRVFKKLHRTVFSVVEGALLVKDSLGSTLVKTDQQSTVQQGQAPGPAQPANMQSLGWASSLPTPHLGKNLALDANGGVIVSSP
jgi:hypothetical protein